MAENAAEFLADVDPEWEGEDGGGRDGGPTGFRLPPEEVEGFRASWTSLQSAFVDDPRGAVEQADNLVDRVLHRLTESFTRERDDLVRRWDHGSEPVSTEDLRVTLQGYRSLLERLLAL